MNIIAITVGSYPRGEASTNRNVSILKGLVEIGHNVKILIISPSNKKCASVRLKSGTIEGINFKYTSFSVNWTQSSLKKIIIVFYSIINALIELNKMHMQEKIDAILILTPKSYIIHPILLFANIKKIKTFHERNEHPLLNFLSETNNLSFLSKLRLKYYLYLIIKISGLYVISHFLKSYFTQYIDESRICIVNMTVDFNRFKGNAQSPFDFKYIAYCGTMHGNKDGLENLINAYALIENKIKYKLVLIGDNQDKKINKILKLVKRKQLRDKIIFTGAINSNEIPRYLKNADILALARPDNLQAKGGFPTKLGEYLMTGKPVIITSVGEIPLFLDDCVSAFIAQPDNIEDFAQKILYISNNYNKSLAVGKEGKKIAYKSFNYRIESCKLSKFISNIVNQ
ncbi:MAG: glycosyltransferase [Bacteroidales bacterium]|nr:glycosyltransferase [Bacteroidales bacterium]